MPDIFAWLIAPKKGKRSEPPRSDTPIWIEQLEEWKREQEVGSDRSVAIIAAANLELILSDLILQHFIHADDVTVDRLLNQDGPLSTFSQIELAYAMGLIIEDDRRELHNIRRICNEFAHSPSLITFSTDAISKSCMKLKFRGEIPEDLKHLEKDLQKIIPPKLYFTHTVSCLQTQLTFLTLDKARKVIRSKRRRISIIKKKV